MKKELQPLKSSCMNGLHKHKERKVKTMNKTYFSDNVQGKQVTLKRIPRNKARNAYNNGLDVLFIPVNCNPINHYWNLGIWENKSLDGQYTTFETLCNAFEFYNCNRETGKYIAFYIPVRTVDRFTGEKPTEKTLETIEEYDYSFMEGR